MTDIGRQGARGSKTERAKDIQRQGEARDTEIRERDVYTEPDGQTNGQLQVRDADRANANLPK